MNNVFVTGNIGIGKSTVINKVIDLIKNNKDIDLNIGGYKCYRHIDNQENSTNFSFTLKSLTSSCSYKILENVVVDDKNNVSIFSDSFNKYSKTLDDDIKKCNLIILDEVGFAESNSSEYLKVLNKVLDSDNLVLGALKKHHCSLVKNVRQRDDILLYEIDENNRNYIYNDIYEILLNILKNKTLG